MMADASGISQPRRAKGRVRNRDLRQLIAEVLPHNAFWAKRFAAAGRQAARPVDARRPRPTAADGLSSRWSKDQLASPPYGTNLTGPPSRFCRLHQTSGTTGTPLRWLDTAASWDWVVSCWQQIYRITGVTADDVVAFPFSFGPFLGFLGRV